MFCLLRCLLRLLAPQRTHFHSHPSPDLTIFVRDVQKGSWNAENGEQKHLASLGYTSTGRKFALLEGVSRDFACAGSNYHVHFTWQVWHGQYSPGF